MSLGVGGDVLEQEVTVLLLSAGQIPNDLLQAVDPVAVVQVLSADEVPPGKKSTDERNLLPMAALFASDFLRAD